MKTAPDKVVPAVSLAVAVNCRTPVLARFAEEGEMTIEAIVLTSSVAFPEIPPEEAVMATVPADFPLTNPADVTSATFSSLEDQVKETPEMTFPPTSRSRRSVPESRPLQG